MLPDIGIVTQEDTGLFIPLAPVFGHVEDHPVQNGRLELQLFQQGHQLGMLLPERHGYGNRQFRDGKTRHTAGASSAIPCLAVLFPAGLRPGIQRLAILRLAVLRPALRAGGCAVHIRCTVCRRILTGSSIVFGLQQRFPAPFIVGRKFDGPHVVLRHQARGLPVIEENGLVLLEGGRNLGIQRSAGTGVDVVVGTGEAGVFQQAGVEGFAHPAGGAVEQAGLAGFFRVGKQAGVAGQILHRFQIGICLLHIVGHIPALHGTTLERVTDDGHAVLALGLVHHGRAPHPLFGNELDVVLHQRRFQRRRRTGHDFRTAAIAVTQQAVDDGGGDLAAFPVQTGKADGRFRGTGAGCRTGRRAGSRTALVLPG